jgi:hypothetical protein
MAEWYTKDEVNTLLQNVVKEIRVQFLRGTADLNDGYPGRDGELTIDKTNWNIRVHDGSTPGGHPVVGIDEVMASTALNDRFTAVETSISDLADRLDTDIATLNETKMDKDDDLFDFGELE